MIVVRNDGPLIDGTNYWDSRLARKGPLAPAALQRPWIAAQAIEHGYTLLTLNPGDFAGLPRLRLKALSL